MTYITKEPIALEVFLEAAEALGWSVDPDRSDEFIVMRDLDERVAVVESEPSANGSLHVMVQYDGDPEELDGMDLVDEDSQDFHDSNGYITRRWNLGGDRFYERGTDQDGGLRDEAWYRGDELHREDGPALKTYNPTTSELISAVWYLDGKHISRSYGDEDS